MKPDGSDICVVVSQLHHGGAERQTTVLLEHLAKEYDIRPLVCCLSSVLEPFGERLRQAGYEIVFTERKGSFEPARALFLRRLLKRRDIRLLHAVHYQAVAYGWLARLGLEDVAFVPAIRSTVYDPNLRKRMLYRLMLPHCRLLIANSVTGGLWLEQFYGVPKGRIHIVPNGLDPTLLAVSPDRGSTRRRLSISEDCPVIVFVGRAKSHKGIPLLRSIYRRVLQARPDTQLLAIGSGLTRAWAQQAFGSHRGVHGLGTREDVYDLIGASDCLLLTSTTEGFPNAVLEAMVLGVPPVTTRVGECPILIDHGTDGFLFDYGDDVAGADLVLRLLQSPPLRASMGESARIKSTERYGTAAMVKATLQVYERALGRELRLPAETPSRG